MTSSQSDESQRFSVFDSYICKEPAGEIELLMRNGPDEFSGLLRTLQRSAEYFTERNQPRVVERIHYEQAMLHLQHENWQHALRILLPLWQNLSWRKSGWWLLLSEVDRALQICATQCRDSDTLIAVQWELLNSSLSPQPEVKFANALDSLSPLKTRPRPQIRSENVLCPVSARLAFLSSQAHVGVPLHYQLVIQSIAPLPDTSIRLHSVNVVFEGPLRDLQITHTNEALSEQTYARPDFRLEHVSLGKSTLAAHEIQSSSTLYDRADHLEGHVDLSLLPASTLVLCLTDIPREAEDLEVAKITLAITETKFDLEIISTGDNDLHQDRLFLQTGEKTIVKTSPTERSHAIKVLPKPPRVHIGLPTPSSLIFMDQRFLLEVNIQNGEDEQIAVQLEIEMLDHSEDSPSIAWEKASKTEKSSLETRARDLPHNQVLALEMLPSTTQSHRIDVLAGALPSEQTLRVSAHYSIKSQPEAPMEVSVKHDILVQRPFEIASVFSPLLHEEPWPDYFDLSDLEKVATSTAHGLAQRWSLSSKIMPLTKTSVVMKEVHLEVKAVHEGAECHVHCLESGAPEQVAAGEVGERSFHMDVQKLEIEDRRLTYVDSHLRVVWSLSSSSLSDIISHVSVPELAIPFGEPRVLASLGAAPVQQGTVHVDYMIENPSTFPLTFSVMLETSDDFAFSGPKNISVQLLPLSRRSIGYDLLPLAKGLWIHPQLRVYDLVFHKTLRVQGANGIKNDKKGIGIWVATED